MIMSPIRSYRMKSTRKSGLVGGGNVASAGPGSIHPSQRIQSARHATSIFFRSTGQCELQKLS